MSAALDVVALIRRKRDGHALDPADIAAFIRGYADGAIPDYQAAALLMAVFLRGMDDGELAALTEAMLRSGDVIDLASLPGAKVDKHSTGGVGDKVSLPLAPAVAACGVRVPMMSGRGLGHSGGTLDKLESIPGFVTALTVEEFGTVLKHTGLGLIGQTERLVPADKKLYALRDVTGTVESIPLIAASIMSKKLAEGIDALVLDVKFGTGAFMKAEADARRLAQTLIGIGRRAGKRVTAFLTDMDQPLGRLVGNAAEVNESLALLRGEEAAAPDVWELTVALGAEMLRLGGAAADEAQGRDKMQRVLKNGEALSRFARCATMQGSRVDLLDSREWEAQNLHQDARPIAAATGGHVTAIDAEKVGLAGVLLRAGRQRKEDAIDPAAYIHLTCKRGEPVAVGAPLCRYAADPALPEAQRQAAEALLRSAYTVGPRPPAARPLIRDVLRGE